MAKTLKSSVLAGGVIYPAGTPSTEELRAKIPNPAHWVGDDEPKSEVKQARGPAKGSKASAKAEG